MSRWITITPDHLKAAGHGAIMDRAQTLAVGGVDPVGYAINAAVSRVRRSVAAANDVDVDATKVPMSLEALTVRIALYDLMQRIGLSLSEDQRKSRDMDASDLNRIADRKVRVEAPDTIDPTSAPTNPGMWDSRPKLIMRTDPVPPPSTQFPPEQDGHANPDAPADAP